MSSADVLGNTSSASVTVSILPRAWASRYVRVRGRRALLRIHCPSSAGCRRVAKLTAGVKARAHRRFAKRLLIGGAPFNLPGTGATTVAVKLSAAGGALVRSAGKRGRKAELVGTGVMHRIVLLVAASR